MMTISVIVGSTRQGRFSENPAQWIRRFTRGNVNPPPRVKTPAGAPRFSGCARNSNSRIHEARRQA